MPRRRPRRKNAYRFNDRRERPGPQPRRRTTSGFRATGRWSNRSQLGVHALASAKPKSLIAFSFRISGRTSGLMSSLSKSLNQRSGRMTGQSEPNSTLCFNNVFAYLTRIGGKYLGDQPDKAK